MNQPSPNELETEMKATYQDLAEQHWQLRLDDPGDGDWNEHWTIDGECCEITNSSDGMEFKSGPDAGNNAHHGVLWTKQSFDGDMKVDFEFTRLDTINRYVCILYFHANGIGEGEYHKDIHSWSALRTEPWMKTYFEKMDMLHLSFAAYGNNDDTPDDYLRVRRYPVRGDRSFSQIEVEGTVHNTGLFLPEKTYKMSMVKTLDTLALWIDGDGQSLYHCWDISKVDPTESGPFGIRQMWQKHSRYKNIKIYTRGS